MRLGEESRFSFIRTQLDLLFCTLVFLCFIIALLARLAKEEKENKNKADESDKINAALTISATWPLGPQDVDLWAMGPDGVAVGWANTRSSILGYLRDDTGKDYSDKNYELITAQGLVPGLYIVNLHLFSAKKADAKVRTAVRILFHRGSDIEVVYEGTVELLYDRHEVTVVQFAITSEGVIDRTSINNVFRSMWHVPQK